MGIPDETRKLVSALSVAIDGSEGLPIDPDERVIDAQGLAVKCLFHASSCLMLYSGTVVAGTCSPVLDTGSMNVLARAAIESSLTFHYLFVAPGDAPLREFRHLSWVLGDLLERQTFHVTTEEHRQQIEDEAKQIEDIQYRLQASAALHGLTANQLDRLLTKGKWRWQSWTEIALDAGMSAMHADSLYRFLCSFAHSGSLSVLQLRQPKTMEKIRILGDASLRAVNIAMAFMTRGYGVVFPAASGALAEDADLAAAVDLWIALGSQE